MFSLRTISGKLIIGLALLFGVASVAVSVVTDHSLNRSLMSSLNQQLQTATDTWYSCVQRSTGDPDHDNSRLQRTRSIDYSRIVLSALRRLRRIHDTIYIAERVNISGGGFAAVGFSDGTDCGAGFAVTQGEKGI